jgi:hypothetical protein
MGVRIIYNDSHLKAGMTLSNGALDSFRHTIPTHR